MDYFMLNIYRKTSWIILCFIFTEKFHGLLYALIFTPKFLRWKGTFLPGKRSQTEGRVCFPKKKRATQPKAPLFSLSAYTLSI